MTRASEEAIRILANATFEQTDRSRANLPSLRDQTHAYIKPIVERVLLETGVITKEIDIAGIACLEVLPKNKTADWDILYAFGGGFVSGSPFEDLAIVARLCDLSGARAVIPDYRLAPEHPFPAAIEDGFAVYAAMSDRPFAIMGESAGGNLALALIQKARTDGLHLPKAAALLSPWCDLSNSGDSLFDNDGRDPTLTRADVEASATMYANGHNVKDPRLSPLFGEFDAGFPPTIITTGTRDLLLSQSVDLADVMRKAGVVVDLRIFAELWHVFEWDDQVPEARESIEGVAGFLMRSAK